ncbi:hypothetical protein [Burkholderia vietnamiensis]|uniref:hypothetical protein n=1 Tax=Burkholderia vietnamiensis TaxID=60552 RepID=UPI0007567622|nr:hypothetical protein [Burkholderia vietnamiensis]KVE99258.1 hypothetical protein WJ03_13220 [Burkholderia vietnamiensis]
MTVTTSEQDISYETDGATVDFPIPFYFIDGRDIVVDKIDANGNLVTLSPGTDFTVSGEGSQYGGTASMTAPIARGFTLHIYREVPVTQETKYQQNDPFPARATETALDKLTMICQQLASSVVNAIRYPLSEFSRNGVLPPAGARAQMLLGFDANGNQEMVPRPASVGAGDMIVDTFIADVDYTPDVSTALPLSRAPINPANCWVYFDAVEQFDFSLSGTSIQFSSPIPSGVTAVRVRSGTTLSVGTAPQHSIGDSQLTWGGILNRTVDSIAALRGLNTLIYSRAFVTGYYAPHDGGGGAYQLDSSDTTSADNGGTIIVATDGGRWKLQAVHAVSLKQFGSKFDGVSDDSATNQAALNWLAVTGGELYAPAGTTINNTALTWAVNKPLKIRGAGRHATIFKSMSTTNTSLFNISNGTVEMSDLALSGSGTSTGGALLTTTVDHVFTRVDLLQYFQGMVLKANVGLLDACNFGTESVPGPISTSSIGIYVDGYAGGLNIINMVGFVPTVVGVAGIYVVSCGALQISDSNIIRQGTNVLLAPGNGQTVSSVMISNCYLDSAQKYNVQLAPAIGGTVVRTYITQAECSSSAITGIQIDGTRGVVDGVLIVSAQANFCSVNGITVTGSQAKNVHLVGGSLVQNAGSGLSVNNGGSARAVGVFAGGGYGGAGNAIGFFCDASSDVRLLDCEGFANSGADFSVPTTATVKNCRGFTSASTGSAVLPSGTAAITVNHNLSGTPTSSNIQITPTVSTGANPLYVDTTSITSSQFTVRCASAAAANFNFTWRATCNGQQ